MSVRTRRFHYRSGGASILRVHRLAKFSIVCLFIDPDWISLREIISDLILALDIS